MSKIFYICITLCFLESVVAQKKIGEGMKNLKMHGRIVGGKDAVPGSQKHMISLQVKNYLIFEHSCGGSIISLNYVITAAHCIQIKKLGRTILVAGAYDVYDDTEPNRQVRFISNVIFHQPKSKTFYDIVLLKTNVPFIKSDFVWPVSLPNKDLNPRDGTMCSLAGWGMYKQNPDSYPAKLQIVQVPIVKGKICVNQPLYDKAKPRYELCAGKKDGGLCTGDSGGPLICPNQKQEMVLTGIISRTVYPCGHKNYPGVSVRVGYFRNWIKAETGV